MLLYTFFFLNKCQTISWKHKCRIKSRSYESNRECKVVVCQSLRISIYVKLKSSLSEWFKIKTPTEDFTAACLPFTVFRDSYALVKRLSFKHPRTFCLKHKGSCIFTSENSESHEDVVRFSSGKNAAEEFIVFVQRGEHHHHNQVFFLPKPQSKKYFTVPTLSWNVPESHRWSKKKNAQLRFFFSISC